MTRLSELDNWLRNGTTTQFYNNVSSCSTSLSYTNNDVIALKLFTPSCKPFIVSDTTHKNCVFVSKETLDIIWKKRILLNPFDKMDNNYICKFTNTFFSILKKYILNSESDTLAHFYYHKELIRQKDDFIINYMIRSGKELMMFNEYDNAVYTKMKMGGELIDLTPSLYSIEPEWQMLEDMVKEKQEFLSYSS